MMGEGVRGEAKQARKEDEGKQRMMGEGGDEPRVASEAEENIEEGRYLARGWPRVFSGSGTGSTRGATRRGRGRLSGDRRGFCALPTCECEREGRRVSRAPTIKFTAGEHAPLDRR